MHKTMKALLDEDSKALFFSFRAVGEPFRALCLELVSWKSSNFSLLYFPWVILTPEIAQNEERSCHHLNAFSEHCLAVNSPLFLEKMVETLAAATCPTRTPSYLGLESDVLLNVREEAWCCNGSHLSCSLNHGSHNIMQTSMS